MPFNLKLGEGLLNEVSKTMQTSNSVDVQLIPPEKILENEDNEGLSMDGIDELQASIEDVGLQQYPLVVSTADGMYRTIAGHRRIAAIRKSIREGNSRYKLGIPCTIENLDLIDLPVSDAIKEKYVLATTNVEARELTTSDKMQLSKIMNIVYDAMKQAGRKPKGRKREFVAEKLNISPTHVQRLEYINQNLILEYINVLDELPIVVADELAHLSKEQQRILFNGFPVKGLSLSIIKTFNENLNQAQNGQEKRVHMDTFSENKKHDVEPYQQKATGPNVEEKPDQKRVHMDTFSQRDVLVTKATFRGMKDAMIRMDLTIMEGHKFSVNQEEYQEITSILVNMTGELCSIHQILLNSMEEK